MGKFYFIYFKIELSYLLLEKHGLLRLFNILCQNIYSYNLLKIKISKTLILLKYNYFQIINSN